MSGRTFGWTRLLLLACACALAAGCAAAPPPQAEEKPTPEAGAPLRAEAEPQTPPRATAEEPPPPPEPQLSTDLAAFRRAHALPPPTHEEVGQAVARVFKGAVLVETGHEPYFVVGDFNGDSSQDLAVIVRPSPEGVAELNDELASLILVAPLRPDPHQPTLSEAHASTVSRRRVYVEAGEALLAVVHGYEAQGWRDPQATQTYVLKDAAEGPLEARGPDRAAAREAAGRLPRLRGDVIAQNVGGRAGFLYYNGAKYAWFDPLRDTAPAPARIVHGGAGTVSERQ